MFRYREKQGYGLLCQPREQGEQQLQKGSNTWIGMGSASGAGISGKGRDSGHSRGQQGPAGLVHPSLPSL